MELQFKKDETTLYIGMLGRLDTLTSPEAEQKIYEQLQVEKHIILDLKELEYISSAGLRLLLSLGNTVAKRDGVLTIRNMNEEVYEVFEITGMCDLFVME